MAYKQHALRELALFAGAGGGILGGKLLGWRTVCAVEWEPYPAAVLAARQNEGFLPPFPIWDDVQTFDGRPWRGIVDVVSGGFPCQDISAAGKGAGITGERSGMWSHMARIIGEVRPRYAFVENSPVLTSRGLDVVLGDLAALGYDAEWGVLGSDSAGGMQIRERIWILACLDLRGLEIGRCDKAAPGLGGSRDYLRMGSGVNGWRVTEAKPHGAMGVTGTGIAAAKVNEHGLERCTDAMADWVDRSKANGNGQDAALVRVAWSVLHGRLMNR